MSARLLIFRLRCKILSQLSFEAEYSRVRVRQSLLIMSDKDDPPFNPVEEIQKQLQEMFGKGKVTMVNPAEAFGFSPQPSESAPEGATEEAEALERIRRFNFKPREIKDYLDRFVVKQSEAKKVLSVAVCDHYNHVRRCLESDEEARKKYKKQNVILLGPTGVGKTYLMQNVADLIGVPYVKADATKFSETGYVGYDVEDIVRDLVKAADGDVELAQYGIIYIDEVDKIASQTSAGTKDVSGRGVQTNLLKLMEDTDVNLVSQTDMMGQMQAMMMNRGGLRKSTISTKHMLFIVSGAFMPMIDIVQKRLDRNPIGFGSGVAGRDEADVDETDILSQAETRDFIAFGFEPEFIGRLPVRVACANLKAEDLEQILTTAEDNILEQYVGDFRGYGITADFEASALHRIAEEAAREKTGARGLMTVLERVLRPFKFELPSTSVKELQVSAELIDDPQATLEGLIEDQGDEQRRIYMQDVRDFAERFQEEHGLELVFTKPAIDLLITESMQADKTVRALCDQKFKDFQYGLKLVHKNTGQNRFEIGPDAAADPDAELSQWVLKSYERSDLDS